MKKFLYILIPVGAIAGLVALVMVGYILVGFFDWISRDPFDWIQPAKPYVSPYQVDIDKCRESGGAPVVSGWSGQLKERV